MKWLLAGWLFALAVALAIGTAALRADNARRRCLVENCYLATWDRIVELRRLSIDRLAEASPERLAVAHWAHLRAAAAHRTEQLQ